MACPCQLVPDADVKALAAFDKNVRETDPEWVVSRRDALARAREHVGSACVDDVCARVEADGALTDANRTAILATQALARPAGSAWLAAWVAIGLSDLVTAAAQRAAAIAAYAAAIADAGWTPAYGPTKTLYSASHTAALADYTLAAGGDLEALARLKESADFMGAVELLPLREQDVELRTRLAEPYADTFSVVFTVARRYTERAGGQRTGNNADPAGREMGMLMAQRDSANAARMQKSWEAFDAWYKTWPKRACALKSCGEHVPDCGCGGCSDTRLVNGLPPGGNLGDGLVKLGPENGNVGWAAPGGGAGGATDLGVTRTSTDVTVTSSTGADATLPPASASEAGVMSAADKDKLDGIAAGATAYTDTQADARVAAGLATHTAAADPHPQYALEADVSAALGLKADLVAWVIPASQLPASVDQIDEFANLAAFPVTGVSNRIYVALDTNLTYRWSGSAYVEISPSIALGSTSSTAHRGDHGAAAYAHSLLTSGNPHGVTKGDVGLANADNTSDANKPVSTAQQAALDLKAEQAAFRASLFGHGNLGDVTVSGSVTPPQQPHYNNLTLAAGAALTLTAGFWVRVADTLDLTACPANGIRAVANAGGNASGTAAGTQAAALTGIGVGAGQRGNTASAGGTAAGTQSASLTAATASNGRIAGTSGAGGAGSGGAGGAARAASAATNQTPTHIATHWLNGIGLILGGGGGSGGGSGGGDGTAGGGSGAGGSGGGCIVIFARRINRGGGTGVRAIQARGGAGGNGGVPAGGNRGGGGGGGGGAGGTIYIVYEQLLGSTATDCLDVTGGAGGAGGNGTGTGIGGNAGGGGQGGKVVLINALTGAITQLTGPAATAGNAASGTTGGAATPSDNAFFSL